MKIAVSEFQKAVSILAKPLQNKHKHELLTFKDLLFKGTPLSGCSRLFQ